MPVKDLNNANKKLKINKLVLCGFGCYRERTEFIFGPGLNSLVAPNERGKSTLVAGLVAVLFGLPNVSDPEAFGKARYRCWEESNGFYSEIYFESGSAHYRVRRDFEKDYVVLERREGEKWVEVTRGEHRSRARRRNVTYEGTIADLTGLNSNELFLKTFCVAQPLQEIENLDRGVQQLLAGAESTGVEALKKLEGWLERITRSTCQLGVTARDKREDRQLEKISKQIEELEREIEASRENAAELHCVREELKELEAQKNLVEREIEAKQRLLEAWNRWRQLSERYGAAVDEQLKLKRAAQELRRLDERIRTLEEEARKKWPEFTGEEPQAEDLGKKISRLAELEREAGRLLAVVGKIKEETGELTGKITAAEEKLNGPLAAGAGRPHLLRDYENLLRAEAELAALEREERELARREEAARQVLLEYGYWAEVEPYTPEQCRRAAERVQVYWQELGDTLDRLKAVEEELGEEFRPFNEGSEEWRRDCRDYHLARAEREKRLLEARSAYESASRRFKEWEEEREKFYRQFADLDGVPEDALGTAESCLALEKEIAGLKAKERQVKAQAWGRIKGAAAGCAALLMVAAVLWFGKAAAIVIGAVLAAAAAAGILGYAGWRKGLCELNELFSKRQQAEQQLAGMRERMGPLKGLPVEELAVARDRLKLYAELKRVLEEKAQNCPSKEEISELWARVESEEEDFARWEKRLAPAFDLGEDPAQAYRRWQNLQEEAKALKSLASTLAFKYLGAGPEGAAGLPLDEVLGEDWEAVRRLAKALRASCERVEEAVQWLANWPQDQWEKWKKEYSEYRRAKEEILACTLKRESLNAADGGGRTRRERLGEEIAKLKEAIYPLTSATPASDVKALAEECRRLEKELEVMRARASKLAEERVGLENDLARIEEERRALAGDLVGVLKAAQGSGEAALGRWSSWYKYLEEMRELSAGRLGALSALNVASCDELEKKVVDADNAAWQLRGEWQKLADAHPGLPPIEAAGRGEELEKEYNRLKSALEELENQKRLLEEKIYDNTKHYASLSGRRQVNVALAEEKVRILKEEEERLKVEAEALALAYRELAAARREFSAASRQRLEETASGYFAVLTRQPGRRVVLDDEFCVLVGEKLDGEIEKTVFPAQLSQGAQDQLQIALRLAIADLLAGDYVLPLIFDDPFLNFDEERLAELRSALERAAADRQLLVLSHREEYRSWGEPVRVSLGVQ